MKRLFRGIREAVSSVLGLLALFSLIVVSALFGTTVLGALFAIVVLGIIIGGVRKLFGIKPKQPEVVKDRKGRPYREV